MTILTKERWEASVAEAWSASIKATYQNLIDEAVKAEREACAKLCDELVSDENTIEYANGAYRCSVRIRSRGEA